MPLTNLLRPPPDSRSGMRALVLLLTLVGAYTLLRGWPPHWHPILRIFLAGTILVAGLALWGRPPKIANATARPNKKPGLADIAGLLIAGVAVESLTLAFLAFAPAHSEELALLVDEALEPEAPAPTTANNNKSPENEATAGLVVSNWLFGGAGPRSLNKSREVRPSNRPEVYLYPASPEDAKQLLARNRFLRNFTLATYREGFWYPRTIVPRTLAGGPQGITRSPAAPGKAISYDILHQANPRQTLAITMPDFTAIAQPSLRETAPDTFRLPRSTSRDGNYRYRVTSVPIDFDEIKTITPGPSPGPEYLALPPDPDLEKKITTLASRFGPASRQSLTALRDHLRNSYTYSLQVDLPEDRDPVESFLFGSRRGYCSHFASATVLLTRAMGIPSRLAFGWSGGRFFQGPKLFVFRAREAHAWAEIYLEDSGWVIFETTPPSRNEGRSSHAPPDETPPLLANETVDAAAEGEATLVPLIKGSLWTAGLALLLLGAGVLYRRQTSRHRSALPGPNLLPEPPHYLAAFRRACQACGCPIPPGRTLRSHLAAFPAPDFTNVLVDYHYAVQYGGQKRNKALEKKLLGQIRQWQKSSRPPSST